MRRLAVLLPFAALASCAGGPTPPEHVSEARQAASVPVVATCAVGTVPTPGSVKCFYDPDWSTADTTGLVAGTCDPASNTLSCVVGCELWNFTARTTSCQLPAAGGAYVSAPYADGCPDMSWLAQPLDYDTQPLAGNPPVPCNPNTDPVTLMTMCINLLTRTADPLPELSAICKSATNAVIPVPPPLQGQNGVGTLIVGWMNGDCCATPTLVQLDPQPPLTF